ncbi:MAG: YebC/PmpR family DNA-binding transcriptional regulator [Malacoplasma sp.]|nr:YebC/PmpR family DNA-binding transcriptional regulator [Malacoplasma sp.]
MPRKHLIASGINKKQQSQAKIWNKLAKEIKAAAKIGGPNPESNHRLKAAIDKALQNNLSKESIEKNIKGASQDKNNQTDYLFEAYGPKGLAIIVQGLTDNQNRLISSLKGYLSKLKAELATPNSVKINFRYCGEILVSVNGKNEKEIEEEKNNLDLLIVETLVDKNLDLEIYDIIANEDCIQILVNPNHFYQLRDLLKNIDIKIIQSEIKYIPNDYVDLDKENFEKLERFLNSCEEDDDIQWVVTNFGEILNE